MVIGLDGKATDVVKAEEDWDDADENSSEGISKALNSLFNEVYNNIFKLIQICNVAKEAWEILKIAHEGTSKVKKSTIKIITTHFENLRMK